MTKMKGYKKQLCYWLLWQLGLFGFVGGMLVAYQSELPHLFTWGYIVPALLVFIADVGMVQYFSEDSLRRAYARLMHYNSGWLALGLSCLIICVAALCEHLFGFGGGVSGIFFFLFVRDVMNICTREMMSRYPAKYDE